MTQRTVTGAFNRVFQQDNLQTLQKADLPIFTEDAHGHAGTVTVLSGVSAAAPWLHACALCIMFNS